MNFTLSSLLTLSMLGGKYGSSELNTEGLKSNCRSS
uniref:Putative PKHD-type hydroxylase At1g22950 isoform X2 n=1 Tax=Rhizophora mucronata TaxID=61149 RepID=A0A2P2JVM7_RHIMU